MKEYYAECGYWGLDDDFGVFVVETEKPLQYHLNPRFDLANHSPTGFAWGYGGSGPAQLALAICADLLEDDERAMRVYQSVKFSVIGKLDQERGFRLTESQLRSAIRTAEEAKRDAQ